MKRDSGRWDVPRYPSSSLIVFFLMTFRLPRRRPLLVVVAAAVEVTGSCSSRFMGASMEVESSSGDTWSVSDVPFPSSSAFVSDLFDQSARHTKGSITIFIQ